MINYLKETINSIIKPKKPKKKKALVTGGHGFYRIS